MGDSSISDHDAYAAECKARMKAEALNRELLDLRDGLKLAIANLTAELDRKTREVLRAEEVARDALDRLSREAAESAAAAADHGADMARLKRALDLALDVAADHPRQRALEEKLAGKRAEAAGLAANRDALMEQMAEMAGQIELLRKQNEELLKAIEQLRDGAKAETCAGGMTGA